MPRQSELGDQAARIHVVAGILRDAHRRVLIADRARCQSMSEHWEFPGGKVAAGETADAALRRELREELGIGVADATHFRHVEHDYPDLRVAIDFFLVTEWSGTPSGCEGQALNWVRIDALHAANLLPADAPVVGALERL